MAETKVGISQINRPAPLWYRRLTNALIMFIIPGLIGLVQGWGMPDKMANRWLMVLGFIPAVLKGIGVMLGNGQNYATEKTAAILIACMLLASCITPAKFQDWAKKHPGESARICSDLYPVQAGYKTGKDNVQYLPVNVKVPGGMVGLYLPVNPAPDSTHHQADTAHAGNLTITWQQVAGGYNILCRADSLQLVLDSLREIHHQVDTQLLVNNAHVRALQADSGRFVQQVAIATARGNNLLKWVLILAGMVVLLLGWTCRGFIIGLVKKLIV